MLRGSNVLPKGYVVSYARAFKDLQKAERRIIELLEWHKVEAYLLLPYLAVHVLSRLLISELLYITNNAEEKVRTNGIIQHVDGAVRSNAEDNVAAADLVLIRQYIRRQSKGSKLTGRTLPALSANCSRNSAFLSAFS